MGLRAGKTGPLVLDCSALRHQCLGSNEDGLSIEPHNVIDYTGPLFSKLGLLDYGEAC